MVKCLCHTHRYCLWMQYTHTVLSISVPPSLCSPVIVLAPQLYVGVVDKTNPVGGGEAIRQPVDLLTSPLWMAVDSFLHLMTVEIFLPESFYSMKKKPAQGTGSTS